MDPGRKKIEGCLLFQAFPAGVSGTDGIPYRLVDILKSFAEIRGRKAADLDKFDHDLLGHFQNGFFRDRLYSRVGNGLCFLGGCHIFHITGMNPEVLYPPPARRDCSTLHFRSDDACITNKKTSAAGRRPILNRNSRGLFLIGKTDQALPKELINTGTLQVASSIMVWWS